MSLSVASWYKGLTGTAFEGSSNLLHYPIPPECINMELTEDRTVKYDLTRSEGSKEHVELNRQGKEEFPFLPQKLRGYVEKRGKGSVIVSLDGKHKPDLEMKVVNRRRKDLKDQECYTFELPDEQFFRWDVQRTKEHRSAQLVKCAAPPNSFVQTMDRFLPHSSPESPVEGADPDTPLIASLSCESESKAVLTLFHDRALGPAANATGKVAAAVKVIHEILLSAMELWLVHLMEGKEKTHVLCRRAVSQCAAGIEDISTPPLGPEGPKPQVGVGISKSVAKVTLDSEFVGEMAEKVLTIWPDRVHPLATDAASEDAVDEKPRQDLIIAVLRSATELGMHVWYEGTRRRRGLAPRDFIG
ncbi:hypothetical protein DFH06DRAFT_1136224 [Mycena polygramma]|nr:hypothetical protein DFH06DRAFT_1136224 [Mycena polygramma]